MHPLPSPGLTLTPGPATQPLLTPRGARLLGLIPRPRSRLLLVAFTVQGRVPVTRGILPDKPEGQVPPSIENPSSLILPGNTPTKGQDTGSSNTGKCYMHLFLAFKNFRNINPNTYGCIFRLYSYKTHTRISVTPHTSVTDRRLHLHVGLPVTAAITSHLPGCTQAAGGAGGVAGTNVDWQASLAAAPEQPRQSPTHSPGTLGQRSR